MTFEIGLVLLVLVGVLALLATTRIAADLIMVAALTALLVVPVTGTDGAWKLGVLTPSQAFAGFSNTGMLTVGVLFIVVTGLKETGGIDWIAARMLGRPRSERGALLRLTVPTAAMSVFLNNTPIVAMMIPAVQDWCKKLGMSPSKLMIPLSYATIVGGSCSLIGTSTNLVVAGLVIAQTDLPPLGMFDITWIGLPMAIAGIGYCVVLAPILLPDRDSKRKQFTDVKEYTLELMVPEGSPLAGRTVEQAGLRALPGCYLAEIQRGDDVLSAVGPEQVLRSGDRLVFVGVVESIKELANTRGLLLATDQVFKLDSPRWRRRLFEAVVARGASLDGRTIREAQFRNTFNAVVIAVARNGERLTGRLGDVRLEAGDLLLVEADQAFAERAAASRDFLLASRIENSTPRRHDKAWLAIAILLAMVGLATFKVMDMLVAGMLASGAMILSRCCTANEARRSVEWSVLVVIAAALGIGRAIEVSGAAQLIAGGVLDLTGTNPWMVLLGIVVVTMVITEIVTNNAAVAITFPIAYAASKSLGVDFMPFVIAIMMAGSACFSTPIGYQTNLMVYGPGGYTLKDFLRFGLPMNAISCAITVGLTPLIFPFRPD
jgi:di/tricarboxylate transporter